MEFTTLQSVVCTDVPSLLGWLDPDPCLVVSDGPRWSSGGTSPPLLAQRGSSSRELRSPSEFLRAVTCPLRLRSGRLPWGFLPLHDLNPQSPRCDGHPSSACVPPSTFRTSSTVCSSAGLASLFRLAAVCRVLAPGDSSRAPAVPTRRRPLPSRRWRRRLPVARLQQTSRRPQGVAPERDPQCPAGCLDPHVTRIPSCVFSSLGILSSDLEGAITPSPLTTFSTRCCVCPARSIPSVSISPWPVALSPERLPVRASLPSVRIAPHREARRCSPFPHGTISLSVIQEYLALRGGPRGFTRNFTCSMLLGIQLDCFNFRIRDYHSLWLSIPTHSSNCH